MFHRVSKAIMAPNLIQDLCLDISGQEKLRWTIPEVIEQFGIADEKLLLQK
jgi:hypothetical protein